MKAIKNIVMMVTILLTGYCKAQNITDSTKYSLLINPFIQIESTEAINSMYNFEFKTAQSHFNYLQIKYPWHPLPYLLKGLNYWWQIVPNYQVKAYDNDFLAYMDTTIQLAKKLKEFNKIESSFFLAAAYAFEGRLYSERRWYRKAIFASKNALKYLDECRGHETYSPELLFGDALYNYYAEWIRDEYPGLKPLMWFFPNGDKEQGLKQLEEVANNSFYSRTEAQYYLMRILNGEKGKRTEALRVGKYLHEQYPNNAYFERYYARLNYQSGRYPKCKELSLSILDKIENGKPGYEENSGRYAAFFLGHIYETRRNYEQSKKYYQMGIKFSDRMGAEDRGYYHYSLMHLGIIAEKEGEIEMAADYYQRVRKLTKNKSPVNKQAKKKLKGLKVNS